MKNKILSIFGILALVLCFTYRTEIVRAVAPYFVRVAATSTATTTPAYMTPGTATSTLTTDITTYGLGIGDIQGDMNLRLALQLTGSSTNSTLNYRNEYSNGSNCGNAPLSCDWYQDSVTTTGQNATTTIIAPFHVFRLDAASTTIGNKTVADNRTMPIVLVPIMARWVRTIFYLPVGSSNASIWAEVLGVTPKE